MGVLLILIVVAALAVALWLALEVNRRRAKRSWEAQREALGDATRDAFRAARHAWLNFAGLFIAWQLIYGLWPLSESAGTSAASTIDQLRMVGGAVLVLLTAVAEMRALMQTLSLIAKALAAGAEDQSPRDE